MSQKQELGGGVPEWIVTFADLMTLLFCFFVLLTTLSTQPKNCGGIQKYLNDNRKRFKHYELRSTKLQCILSLPSDFLFVSGGDAIKPRALNAMAPMFKAIKSMDEHKNDLITVEGHTDNVPIRTRRFPSNWELSSARATNMAAFLVNRIRFPGERLSVGAYADGRPKVEYVDHYGKRKTGKALREARKANRRVEIILSNQPKAREDTTMLFDGN
ncbi:MAG: OmpA family protein [Proteobacteria bacterium]|nr:OmpA family protein [Pseudomonadota bacterium]